MTREPMIVTNGWAEMSASLAKTGFFEEDQLKPGTVPEILINLVTQVGTFSDRPSLTEPVLRR